MGIELSRRNFPELSEIATCFPGTEALRWMRNTSLKFDAVIGNPPYASASELSQPIARSLQLVGAPDLEEKISLTANIWLGFVLASINVLEPGGSLGFVLPAAWDYASYAARIRSWLPSQFESFGVFRSDTPLFKNVSEGCIVIVGHNYKAAHQYSARFECRNIDSICAALERFSVQFPICEGSASARSTVSESQSLRDLLDIRLGGVTGQATYFIFSESERLEFGLPVRAMVPVISKARHLRWPAITRERWRELLQLNEPIWLFRPRAADVGHPNIKAYLALRKDRGGCDRSRLKIKNRTPWHTTPLPANVDGFLSGMTSAGVRIVFSEMAQLSATNTIYTVSFRSIVPKLRRFAIARYLIEGRGKDEIRSLQRHYAGGLRKLEPGDILSLRVPKMLPDCTLLEYNLAFSRS